MVLKVLLLTLQLSFYMGSHSTLMSGQVRCYYPDFITEETEAREVKWVAQSHKTTEWQNQAQTQNPRVCPGREGTRAFAECRPSLANTGRWSWLVYCRAIWAPRREFGSVDSHVLPLAHLHLKPGFRVGGSSKYSSVDVAQWNWVLLSKMFC